MKILHASKCAGTFGNVHFASKFHLFEYILNEREFLIRTTSSLHLVLSLSLFNYDDFRCYYGIVSRIGAYASKLND